MRNFFENSKVRMSIIIGTTVFIIATVICLIIGSVLTGNKAKDNIHEEISTIEPEETEAVDEYFRSIFDEKIISPIEPVTIIETVVVEVEIEVPVEVVPEDYYYLKELCSEIDSREVDRTEYFLYIFEQYPEASVVWKYLTVDLWLNNYVAAGIMGNMMNECGGNSLKLQPLITSKHSMVYKGETYHFYGLCQWYLGYNPQLAGASLDKQLDYIGSNIEEIFDNYGYLYKKGFKYADFCALTDCKEASTAFMVVYERPGPSTKITRQNNACYAYSVFVR